MEEAPPKEEPEEPINDLEFPDFADFGFEDLLAEEPKPEEEKVVEKVVEVVPEPPKEKTEYEKMQEMLGDMP